METYTLSGTLPLESGGWIASYKMQDIINSISHTFSLQTAKIQEASTQIREGAATRMLVDRIKNVHFPDLITRVRIETDNEVVAAYIQRLQKNETYKKLFTQ